MSLPDAGGKGLGRQNDSRRWFRNAIARVWSAFAITAVVIGLFDAWWGHDHLLRSDDPYLVGFACGVLAAGMGLAYSIADWLVQKPLVACAWCYASLAGWVAFLLILSLEGGEGGPYLELIAEVSAVTGILITPVLVRPPGKWVIAAASVAVITGMVMYYLVWFVWRR